MTVGNSHSVKVIANAVPSAPTVEVIAPSDLEAGYYLDIEVNNQLQAVIVPEGGVVEGQRFVGILVAPKKEQTAEMPIRQANIPNGAWRHGLLDCCSDGCCKPECCMSLWLSPVMLGQVLIRMHLNACGKPGNPPAKNSACMIFLITFAVLYFFFLIFFFTFLGLYANYTACIALLSPSIDVPDYSDYSDDYFSYGSSGSSNFPDYSDYTAQINNVCNVGGWAACLSLALIVAAGIMIYNLIVMCMARKQIRKRYNIESGCACEDCCAAYFCGFCTIYQMARHTHDYDAYPVECCGNGCCSKTGQSSDAPPAIIAV